MDEELERIFTYTNEFYRKRLGLIIVFSVPFLISFLLLSIVSAPTYLALGGLFLRTGSLPELGLLDIIITVVAYVLAVFLIADTIVNINIIVRSKRTLTSIKHEVLTAMGKYGTRIFYIYTLAILLLLIVQLVFYDHPLKNWIYPVFTFVLTSLLLFVAPAVVIDNSDTPTAIRRSVSMALKNWTMVIIWAVLGLVLLSVLGFISFAILPVGFSSFFILLVNSLFILPYLIVLQTQMYMEKYPLAR